MTTPKKNTPINIGDANITHLDVKEASRAFEVRTGNGCAGFAHG